MHNCPIWVRSIGTIVYPGGATAEMYLRPDGEVVIIED
jgi:hypothetical protein